MNLNEGNSVSVRINHELVTARIVQFISNTDILVELVGATYYGQRVISISAEDIIDVIDNDPIQNRVPNINSVMPAAYSQSSRSLFPNITTIIPFPDSNDDLNRNGNGQSFPGGKKSRRNLLKKKHSKRY
jgi:hypothetical protein